MELYVFDEIIDDKPEIIVATEYPEFNWAILKDDKSIGWINILMSADGLFSNKSKKSNMAQNNNSHSIKKLKLPEEVNADILEDNMSSHIIVRNPDTRGPDYVDFQINAKIKNSIYNNNFDFDGVDEYGNLVSSDSTNVCNIYQASLFLNTQSASDLCAELNIRLVIASIGTVIADYVSDNIVIVYDIIDGVTRHYTTPREFVDTIISHNCVYAGQILIDDVSTDLKNEAADYIKMISTELLS